MALRVCIVLVGLTGVGFAGGVTGRLELPAAPDRPGVVHKGFLDRVENPLATVRPINVGPHLVVVLENDAKPEASGQVAWDLAGESFNRPLLVVAVGAEILITNKSKTARTLIALEDPKLIPQGPINPTGPKSFRVTEARSYTITDKDAPHLRGTLLVVPTTHFAMVEVTGAKLETGTFTLADVPEGTYKVRVFYKDGWIDRPDETVTVPAKRSVELAVKIPAGFPLKK